MTNPPASQSPTSGVSGEQPSPSQSLPPRTALLVLGAHRSGTSATTRVLNLLGAQLPDRLLPPVPGNNSMGFWESADLMDIHEEILATIGTAWHLPIHLTSTLLEKTPEVETFKPRLLAFLNKQFTDSSLFVLKDPRMCLLLPIWQDVLAQFPATPKAVLALRHPTEVAASLHKRDGFSLEHSLLLWLLLNLEAERNSRGIPRITVSFDALLRDWREEASRISRALHVQWPVQIEEASPDIDRFLDSRERHHHAEDHDPPRSDLGTMALEGYALLQRLGSPNEVTILAELDRLAESLRQRLAGVEPLLHQLSRDALRLKTTLQKTNARLTEAGAALHAASQQAHAASEQHKRQTQSLEDRLRQAQNRAAEAESQLQAVYASTAWRVSLPVRFAGTLKEQARRRLRGILRSGTHALAHGPAPGSRLHESTSVPQAPQTQDPCPDLERVRKIVRDDHALATPGPAFPLCLSPRVHVVVLHRGSVARTFATLHSLAVSTPEWDIAVTVLLSPSSESEEPLLAVPGLRVQHLPFTDDALPQFFSHLSMDGTAASVVLDAGVLPCRGWLTAGISCLQSLQRSEAACGLLLAEDGHPREAHGVPLPSDTVLPFRHCDLQFHDHTQAVPAHALIVSAEALSRCLTAADSFILPVSPDADFVAALGTRLHQIGARIHYQPEMVFLQVDRTAPPSKSAPPTRPQAAGQVPPVSPELIIRQQARPNRPTVLFIDAHTPSPDADSGSNDTWYFLQILKSLGYAVTFLPAAVPDYIPRYTPALQKAGIRCLYTPHIGSPADYLTDNAASFDLIFVAREPIATRFLPLIRKHAPHTKLVFDTVDLHYLREERQAQLQNSERGLRDAARTRERELRLVRQADAVLVRSQYEQSVLEQSEPSASIFHIPIVREIPGLLGPRDGRRHIVFIGGYRHAPNVDAVLQFVSTIWPHIKQRLPDAQFWMVGSYLPETLLALARQDHRIIPIGHVGSLDTLFRDCMLTVAPLRFGAGAKGKVITSLSYGVPCIATRIAAEGMALEHGKHILVEEDPEAFAEAVATVYQDRKRWDDLSRNGLEAVRALYSVDGVRPRFQALLSHLDLPSFDEGDYRWTSFSSTQVSASERLAPPLATVPCSSFHEYRDQMSAALGTEIRRRRRYEHDLAAAAPEFTVPGACVVCNKDVSFSVDLQYAHVDSKGARYPNFRERLVCPSCQLNSRKRAAFHFLRSVVHAPPGADIYAMEQTTSFYRHVKRLYPNTIGSEFLADNTPLGQTDPQGIRNEDATQLSFPNASLDYILSFDVLEHIPHYLTALQECHRCLRPGGALLLTAPFRTDFEANLVRARVSTEGIVEHLEEPQYHGDPIQPNAGILAYYTFGWELLDDLRSVGFSQVQAHFYWSPAFGYLGENPFLLLARRIDP